MANCCKKIKDDVLSEEIKHDDKVIARKEEREVKHEEQLKKDNTELFQDIRDAEIDHDEKVINRKEKDLEKHEEELKK